MILLKTFRALKYTSKFFFGNYENQPELLKFNNTASIENQQKYIFKPSASPTYATDEACVSENYLRNATYYNPIGIHLFENIEI